MKIYTYRTRMNERPEDFRITVKEFRSWLKESGEEAEFSWRLKRLWEEDDYEELGSLYCIPISMIKYLLKEGI